MQAACRSLYYTRAPGRPRRSRRRRRRPGWCTSACRFLASEVDENAGIERTGRLVWSIPSRRRSARGRKLDEAKGGARRLAHTTYHGRRRGWRWQQFDACSAASAKFSEDELGRSSVRLRRKENGVPLAGPQARAGRRIKFWNGEKSGYPGRDGRAREYWRTACRQLRLGLRSVATDDEDARHDGSSGALRAAARGAPVTDSDA